VIETEAIHLCTYTPSVVIAGTGRAGTTFMVKLLHRLRLARLGKEAPETPSLFKPPIWNNYAPVIKAPWLTKGLPTQGAMLARAVTAVIVPFRDLNDVVRSFHRRKAGGYPWSRPAGSWLTTHELSFALRGLDRWCEKYSVPMRRINFPRHVRDAEYLHAELVPVFPELADRWIDFERQHRRLREGPRVS